MSKKRMLADVLWKAANKHLQPPGKKYEGDICFRFERYSCCAVAQADPGLHGMQFLASLGCSTWSYCPEMNDDQGTRYIWLLLAMHVAEDEGITA